MLCILVTWICFSAPFIVGGKPREGGSVLDKPEIFERPQAQRVHVNQTAIFSCRTRSRTRLTINWLKGDQQLKNITGSILLRNDTLKLLQVSKSDQGIYKCVAKNNAGTTSSQTTLTVLDPLIAPVITKISANLTVSEGSRVTFTCEATGNPSPEIKWNYVGTRQLERPSPGSIRILSAVPTDTGLYSCIAENIEGSDSRTFSLKVIGYPVFLVSPPSNISVNENTTVSLNCKVIGFPVPEVRWFFGNKQVESSGRVDVLSNKTLVITAVSFDDNGMYSCVANNSKGLRCFKTTVLRVLRMPKLPCCPNEHYIKRNQTAIHGESTTLNCSALGYPEPKYHWQFDNQTVSSLPVLTILKVSSENQGVYYCNVSNNFGSLIVETVLVVLVFPNVSVYPIQTIAVAGQNVFFECSVTGEPIPDVKWYSSRNTKPISQNHTLVIANVSGSDHGEYRCKGTNKAGTHVATSKLVVAVPPTFVLLSPRNITANESMPVLLACSAKGPDKPSIRWYRIKKDGPQPISIGHYPSITSQKLAFSSVKKSDDGVYVCEASNHAGMINISFVLSIQYAPVLIQNSMPVDIVAGREAFLNCPINGNPKPQILWATPASTAAVIHIQKVNITHRGRYKCIGRNKLGSILVTVEVRVLTPPRISSLTMETLHNNWASLMCETIGIPNATVEWVKLADLPFGVYSKNKGKLDIDKQYIGGMNFSCNASNIYGWISKNVRVPTSPVLLTAVNITSHTVMLSWKFDRSEFVSQFTIERISPMDSTWIIVKASPSSTMYTCLYLEPFTCFTFRLRAHNLLGTSVPSETLNVTTLEGVPSTPAEVVIQTLRPTSVTVSWKLPRKPRGLLNNILYEIQYMKHIGSSEYVKVEINSTITFSFNVANLKSSTRYTFKVRAGRKAVDGAMRWSNFETLQVTTLQEAPTIAPEILRAVSSGPDRIFISWKKSQQYVEGYKLRYTEYNSSDNVTIVEIRSWKKTDYMIIGLNFNKYYKIQMTMFTSGGDGPWSIPVVTRTEEKPLSLASTEGLPWKIGLGGSILIVVLLSFILGYVYFSRRPKQHPIQKDKAKSNSRKGGGFDFDNTSHGSDDSNSTIHGVYNVNAESDVDLSMFENSNHTSTQDVSSNLYVENPILPSHDLDSDDSYEAVRLATFTARPSPLPTRCGSPGAKTRQHLDPDNSFPPPPSLAQGKLPAKPKESYPGGDAFEQLTDDILI